MFEKKMMWQVRIEYLDEEEAMTSPYEEFYYRTRAEAEKAAEEFEMEEDIVEAVVADEPEEVEMLVFHHEEEMEL